MQRKLAHLIEMINRYKAALDHAKTAKDVNTCLRMIRAYEDAYIALEEASR